jgi:hypothetical protein
MRFSEFKQVIKIVESKGLFGRIPDDPYVKDDGSKAVFISIIGMPDMLAGGGQFPSVEERDEAIAEFEKNVNGEIEWTNKPDAGSLAFGIAELHSADGDKTMYWGRYFRIMKANMMSAWPNASVPQGWKLATKGAAKMDQGLEPQALIKTNNLFKGPDSVIRAVGQNSKPDNKDMLVKALEDSANGQMAVFPGQREIETAIRDYFGEIMGPVAMMGGAVTGQAEDARQELGGGAEWKDMSIRWPQGMNEPLVDSKFFAPNGTEIGISSKGGVGASASVKNLHDGIVKATDSNKPEDKKLLTEHEYVVDIVTTIQKESSKDGPFALGEKFGLTTPQLRDEVIQYQKNGKKEMTDVSEEAAKLMQGINFSPTNTVGFNTGNAITSAVAKKVAQHVNSDKRFSQGALALLNNASIIQLYTKTGVKGDDVSVKGYQAVYPPNFQGTIGLDGGKNYYSSRIGGKFAFKFLK